MVDIDFANLIQQSFYEKTFKQTKIMAEALRRSELHLDGRCHMTYLTLEDMRLFEANSNDLEGIVNRLKQVAGVDVAVFMYELEPGIYKASIRTSEHADAIQIASEFGGGGHLRSAGCSISGTYETVAATEAINAFGITTGISEAITDPEAFAGVAWVMTIGICFSLVLLPFVAKPLHKKFLNAGKKKTETEAAVTEEKATETADSKKKKRSFAGFMDYVTPALFIGLIGAFISNSILGAGDAEKFGDGAGVLSVITLVTSVVVSIVLELVAKKFKLTWLEPFIMPIGMILGMVAAIVAYNVLPPEIAMLEWRG